MDTGIGVAGVHYVHFENRGDATTFATAVFHPDPPVTEDFGRCRVRGPLYCTPELEPGEHFEVEGHYSLEYGFTDPVWVTVGGLELTSDDSRNVYSAAVAGGGPAALGTEVELQSHAFGARPPVLGFAPEPMQRLDSSARYGPDDAIEFRWQPFGGRVELVVSDKWPGAAFGRRFERRYVLEDVGFFDLPLADLDLNDGNLILETVLSRSSRTDAERNGRDVQFVLSSDVALDIEVIPVHGRTEVPWSPTCDLDQPSLDAGSYWTQTVQAHSYFGYPACLGGEDAYGLHSWFPIEVPAHHRLVVRGDVPDGHVAVALHDGCTDACLAGSHTRGVERARAAWSNTTGESQHIGLFLNHEQNDRATIRFDVEIQPEPISTAVPAIECATAPAVPPGLHQIPPLAQVLDTCDPFDGNFLEFEVPGDGVLIVKPDNDRVSYWTYDSTCGDCVPVDERMLRVRNPDPEPDRVRVDLIPGELGPHPASAQMSVWSTQTQYIDLADTCTSPPTTPILTRGVHLFSGNYLGLTNTQPVRCDPHFPAPAPDGSVRARLQPGERLEATLDHPSGIVAVDSLCPHQPGYAVCSSPGGFDPRTVVYDNVSTDVQEVFVIVDNREPVDPGERWELEILIH